MSDAILARLKQIGLTELRPDAAHPQARWAFDAAAGLFDSGGVATGLSDLRLGIGNAPDAEQLLGAAQGATSPGLVQGLSSAQGLWLGFGVDAALTSGVPDRPVWLAVISGDGIDLLGAHPLPPTASGGSALDAPGLFEFLNPLLRVRLRATAGATVERLEVACEGQVKLLANFGPFGLANSSNPLIAAFRLTIAVPHPLALGAVLTNPGQLLDTSFQGELQIDLPTSRPIAFAGGSLTGSHQIQFRARVTSPSRSRSLSLDHVDYTHSATGSVTVGDSTALQLNAVSFTAAVDGWTAGRAPTLDVRGEADVVLPAAVQTMLAGAGSGHAAVALHHEGSGSSERIAFSIALDRLELKPQANPLGFAGGLLSMTLSRSGTGPWSLAFAANARQSWTQVARSLSTIVSLPAGNRYPDLECSFALTRESGKWSIALGLRLLEAGGSEPYVGLLGPFPIDVADTRFDLTGSEITGGWDWKATGSGRFTARDQLATVLPFQELPITCELVRPGTGPGVLAIKMGAGLPPLLLPPIVRGGPSINLLTLQELTVRLAADFELVARVNLVPSLGNTATRLGLPSELRPLLDPLIAQAQGSTGELRFTLRDNHPSLAIQLLANPSAPALDLFGLFAQVVPGRAPTPAPGARANASMEPLLLLKPASILFEAASERDTGARLRFAVAAICTVQRETFDATLSLSASGASVEVSLLAGSQDPILIRVPGPDTAALVANIDQQIRSVLNLYGISRSSQTGRDLENIGARLQQILASPEADTLIAFEIIDLGVTLRLDPASEPLSIAGGVRIVQFPPILDLIFTGPTPALILGSSGTSIFIELRPAPATGPGTPPPPLIRIPVTTNANVDVVIHALRFGYSWQPPSFELTLRSDVIAPDLPFRGGVGFKLPAGNATAASASMDIDLQIPSPPAPPVPMLQWQMSFLGANPTTATRGLEFIVGASETDRLLTIYLRETVFSPSFFMLMPGGMVDFGMFLGPPPEARNAATFYFDFRCGRGSMITVNPVIGVMLNPMALLPPFFTPNPPYWVIPPSLMGDYFTDPTGATGIELRANIPLLIEFEAIVKRPLPVLNLQMFLEVALLVSEQFAVELPQNSALKNLFYAGLSGRVRIHALNALFDTDEAALAANIEFNVVEIINGAIRLNKQIRDVIDDAGRALARTADLVADLATDPKLLVKMMPRQHRSVALDTRFAALGFSLDCNLSAYLLLPEELREELRMFHENVRPRRKDAGAFQAAPPAGTVVDRPVTLDRDALIEVTRITNHRGFLLGSSLTRVEGAGRQKLRLAMDGPLLEARTRVVDASALKIAGDVAGTSGSGRRTLLQRHGLATKETEINAKERDFSDNTRFRSWIETRIRADVERTVTYSVEIVHAAMPAGSVIQRIVADAMVRSPNGTVQVRPDVRAILQRHLPRVQAKKIAANVQRALQQQVPPRPVTLAQFDQLRHQLEAAVHALLEQDLIIGRDEAVRTDDIASTAETIITTAWMRNRANTQAAKQIDPRSTAIFKGTDIRDRFRGFRPGAIDSAPPPPSNETEDPQGYEIRLRKEHAALAPTFAVPVRSPATRFQVRLQAGTYRLLVRQGNTTQAQDLPAALVASVPFGPKKASELRRRLTIGEKRVHRALTAVEKERRNEGQDQHVTGLYKTSILYSPEYELRSEGGKRGPLYLADLLRKADGSYVTFNQPIAIAGFRVELLKASSQTGGLAGSLRVRFCGLVAAGSHLLAFGFAQQTLQFGSFRAELGGEFRLAVGDVATVNIPGSTAITPNSIGFAGLVRLRDGGKELLAGEASGSIAREAGVTTLRLNTKVHVEWSDEFEVGEVKLLKAWISADLDVSLKLGRTLEASLDTSITVHYAFGEFDTDMVDVGFIVCVPLTDVCWRENKRIEVIDFSDMDWGDEQTLSGRLKLDLKSGASGAAFKGSLTANIPQPGGGTFALNAELPSFTL